MEEERKRAHRNALRRASYRRKKELALEEDKLHAINLSDNATSSAYTTLLSHPDSAYTATSTETYGLVNDNDQNDIDENILEETCLVTEEDRKRDHINALRRAAYRRRKDKLESSENLRMLYNSDTFHDDATLPPPSLDASGVTHDNEGSKRIQRNSRSRAFYHKKNEELTVDDRDDLNEKIRGKRVQRRKSRSDIEKGQSSAQRKACYAKRKNTPCKESLALPRPDITNSTADSLAIPLSRAADDGSSDGDPPPVMPNYGVCTPDDINVFPEPIMGDEPTPAEMMDEEYYLYRDQGSDNDAFEDDEEASMTSFISGEVDPLDCVYTNIPDHTHILKLDTNCKHCKAIKFVSETDGFCCRNGQIKLKQPEPIPELMRLWSSMDADSRHFRENIRFFNGHFAFTTLGVSLDENYTNMKSGVYTFRVHGTIYHNVHSFGPSSRPEHLQLYFYDDDPTITHRKAATNQLDQEVVKKLVDILKENPYSQQFRSLGAHKGNLDDYRIDLNTDKRLDQRKYNRPLSSEVAAIWVEGSELAKRFDRRITLYGNNNERHSIRVSSGAYDPLSYPLFYPRGELGWHPKLPKRNVPWEAVLHPQLVQDDDEDAEGNNRLCVSVRDYYCYMLQTRPAIFNPILCGARLLQQWAVDMYVKIESCRLRWYRKNQTQIRADLYKGVVDAITSGETRASAVGVRIVLPGTYPGGDRDMKKRHMDAMAIVHTYGKPDIFLTMTCNPKWDEITNELLPGQTAQDRPDIVARVFYGKLEHMKYMLFKKHILGVVVAYVYVVEFQKRGLPTHIFC
ncbi:uncharacterized protein LOC125549342 isoform X1 [Triticum urartu]|nr:uncharacterized protein LOC125549342 isoform X1 [Triticum urartu]XP_048568746.1 uncharacterized protein LOC125549342 isoform X1 [Triticum urartu]